MAEAGKYKVFRGLMWVGMFIYFCGWVVMLGGNAALQENCTGTTPSQPLALTAKAGSTGAIFAWKSCTHFYQWQWWTTSFAIVTWFVHLFALLRRLMVTTRLLIIALHVVNFSYLTWQTNTIWYLEEGVKAAGFTTLHTRGAVYLAGCIICSVISGAFFIMLGSGRSASLERIYHGVGDDTAAPAKGDDLTKGGKDSAAAVVEHNVVESAV